MIDRILNIMLIVLFVITAVLLGLFLFGGEAPGADPQYWTPAYTSSLLNWSYILCVIACVAALIFPIIRLLTRPKEAMKSFIGVAVIAVFILIAYSMSDGTPLNLIGYTGPDNVPSTLLWTDTTIYTMYFLFAAAILAIVGGELYRKFR
ncbi:MAG: hypothetical protein LBR65_01140 [Culturomica sp.]|jgi:hypothetical protein|nr:hypothetical protein [Culturomica sp.]